MQELAVLAARAMGTQRQFTAVADNIANANTSGYRRLDVQFRELVSKPDGKPTASYVSDRGVVLDYTMGALQKTNNPLDVAIAGDGFFATRVGDDVHYTRRGQFTVDGEGTLVTPEGYPVLDNANAPIQFPAGIKQVVVAKDGTISTEQGQLAQLGVFQFAKEDQGKLRRTGDVSFTPEFGALPQVVEAPKMEQGFLEASNVNAVEEMVTMQAVSRAYQNSLKMMQGLEDTEQRAIRSLGQVQ